MRRRGLAGSVSEHLDQLRELEESTVHDILEASSGVRSGNCKRAITYLLAATGSMSRWTTNWRLGRGAGHDAANADAHDAARDRFKPINRQWEAVVKQYRRYCILDPREFEPPEDPTAERFARLELDGARRRRR